MPSSLLPEFPVFQFRDIPTMPDIKGVQAISRDKRELTNGCTMLQIRCAFTGKDFTYRGPVPCHDDRLGDCFIVRGYVAPKGTVMP